MPGNKHLKRALCQCAWSCIRSKGADSLRCWFWSIVRRSGKQKALVALSRKILTLIFALLRSGTFYDPSFHLRSSS